MKLKKDDSCVYMEEYKCSLTKKLDDWAGLSGKDHFHLFRHYIFTDEALKKEKCLAIRVPGGTVGAVSIMMIITSLQTLLLIQVM